MCKNEAYTAKAGRCHNAISRNISWHYLVKNTEKCDLSFSRNFNFLWGFFYFAAPCIHGALTEGDLFMSVNF